MPLRPDLIPRETLRQLHRSAVEGEAAIRALLDRARTAGAALFGGVTQQSTRRVAQLVSIGAEIRIEGAGLSTEPGRQLALNFELDGTHYFFVSRVLGRQGDDTVDIAVPSAIYLKEDREMLRVSPSEVQSAASRVELQAGASRRVRGEVADWTYHGMAVDVPGPFESGVGEHARLRLLDGPDSGVDSYAEIRHRKPVRQGWVRLGLSVSRVPPHSPLDVEVRECLSVAKASSRRPDSPVSPAAESEEVLFENSRGEPIRGLVDRWGEPRGATAVVLPAAWSRTKETLLPLAATVVESFRRARLPVAVLRFDGTRRRGESYVPPEFRHAGAEYLGFRFSQAVDDTKAAIRFMRSGPKFRCDKAVLVTSSLSSVEGRRVVSADGGRDIAGWISLVGIADLQSALHLISGGVDYGHGLLKGLKFGRQELFGVLVDVDSAGADSITHGLTFLEDARRDMNEIAVPVCWISGRFDAWVDKSRVRALMSCGDASRRRILELPIGHQLRTSEEAFYVFRLIAEEVARISVGASIAACNPEPSVLSLRGQAERKNRRLSQSLQAFWREYLLGRSESLGSEMLTATDVYRDFLDVEAERLELRAGQRVLDLGCGTGEFIARVIGVNGRPANLEIHGVDFVREALGRAVARTCKGDEKPPKGLRVAPILANLDLARGLSIPLASASYDRVLASLLVNYVNDPQALLEEILRLLRRSGLAVVSSLRRDADISKIYVDALADRYSERAGEAFGQRAGVRIDRSLPSFLNSASRLLELEDQGRFCFFDPEELKRMMEGAGFRDISVAMELGDPPQAVVARGRRP